MASLGKNRETSSRKVEGTKLQQTELQGKARKLLRKVRYIGEGETRVD